MLIPLRRIDSSSSRICLRAFTSCAIVTGDATLPSTYSDFNGRRADVLITDPPYCLLHRKRRGGDLRDPKRITRKLDDDEAVTRFNDLAEYSSFTKAWLHACLSSLKPEADLVIWSNALGKSPIQKSCNDLGYAYLGEFLWAKHTTRVNPQSIRSEVLLRVYESALIFRHRHKDPISIDRALPWSVVTGYHDEGAAAAHPHPCRKPVVAVEPLVLNWTRPNDLVLDPFVGSGGIVEACLQSGRSVIGVERLSRWSQHTEEKAAMWTH